MPRMPASLASPSKARSTSRWLTVNTMSATVVAPGQDAGRQARRAIHRDGPAEGSSPAPVEDELRLPVPPVTGSVHGPGPGLRERLDGWAAVGARVGAGDGVGGGVGLAVVAAVGDAAGAEGRGERAREGGRRGRRRLARRRLARADRRTGRRGRWSGANRTPRRRRARATMGQDMERGGGSLVMVGSPGMRMSRRRSAGSSLTPQGRRRLRLVGQVRPQGGGRDERPGPLEVTTRERVGREAEVAAAARSWRRGR